MIDLVEEELQENPFHVQYRHMRSQSDEDNPNNNKLLSQNPHNPLDNKMHFTTPENIHYKEKQLSKLSFICKICQASKEDYYKVVSCEHYFCVSCITEYIQFRITEAQVSKIPCPNHECDKEILQSEIEQLVPKTFYDKYLLFKQNAELNNNPFLRWCPVPNCTGYDIGNVLKTKLVCGVCSHKFCYYCSGDWHKNDKCKLRNEQELDEWSMRNGARFCPNCRVKVQKTTGCDHMTCPRCKYEWCWLCGEKFMSGHLFNCAVVRDRKWNKPMIKILAMVFSILILFTLPVFVLGILVYETERGYNRSVDFLFRCLKKPIIVYSFIVVLGIILIPFYYSLGPIIFGIFIMYKFLRSLYCSKCCRCIFSPILGIIISPLIPGVALIVVSCITLSGLFFLITKIVIAIRKCINPKYKVINMKYRPIN